MNTNNNNNNNNNNNILNKKNELNDNYNLIDNNYFNNYSNIEYLNNSKYKEDIIQDLNIIFEESYFGCIKSVNIKRYILINNFLNNENETIYVNIPWNR